MVAKLETPIEEWPYLDGDVLLKTRSRKVCMTCHRFRHHAGVNCIPVLTCRLHQGLITCQATLKTEPLPTSKTEPPLTPGGRLFSASFRLGLAGGWFGACSSFS
jgi:hypothetical protein